MLKLMSVGKRSIGFVLVGSVLLCTAAWAGAGVLEGMVRDSKGHPISGADVRIGNNSVKTDARGHYVANGLPTGTYRVTLSVGGSVKASINNAGVKGDDATQLNFDLKSSTAAKASASAKKGKHMVWVPAQTGSHIGGRWVEVDDSSSNPGMERVDTASGEALRKFQSTQPNRTESSLGR